MGAMPKIGLTGRIILGLVAGIPVGLWLGADAAVLGEIGKVVIQAIKLAAAPLLILTIVGSVLSTHVDAKDGARMLFFALVNSVIALSIGLLLSNVLKPGLPVRHLVRGIVGDRLLKSGLRFVETSVLQVQLSDVEVRPHVSGVEAQRFREVGLGCRKLLVQ